MPTYQYECDGCGHTFEYMQSMVDEKLKKCPQCSTMKLYRLIGSGAGVIFKGSGFYETDYKNKVKSPNASSSSKSEVKPSTSDKSTKKSESSKDT